MNRHDCFFASVASIFFPLEWTSLWLRLSFHSLNAFSDPHVWPLIEKGFFALFWNLQRHVLVALLLTERCTSSRRILLPTLTHRWLVWWFLFWKDVSTSFIIQRFGILNWESRVAGFYINHQSISSKNKCRDNAWHYRRIVAIYSAGQNI